MWLLKHHRLVPIKQNPVLDVPADGARKDDLLDVAAFFDELFHGVAIRDPDHILLDDRAIVEYFGDIVGGRADELHPPLEGLVIWPGADESRQERVMDVDQVLGSD